MAPKAKSGSKFSAWESGAIKSSRSRKKAAAVGPKPASAKMSPEETNRRIRIEAYYLWVKRGRKHGGDRADWLEAERRLKSSLL